MIIYIGIIGILILWKSRICRAGFFDSYLSKETCNAMKGIFILLIFASHFSQYVSAYTNNIDIAYWAIRVALGQCVVALFLFYSGYGVMISAKKKGSNYIDLLPRNRILPTWQIYGFSQVLFLALQLSMGRMYTIRDFILSFLAWQSFGNDNWYIFVILGLYFISWVSLRHCGKSEIAVAMGITLGTIIFIMFLLCAKKGAHWYNTMLCYPVGVWYAICNDKIESFLKRGNWYWCALTIVLGLYITVHKVWRVNLVLYEITAMFFTLSVVLITMKFQINNRFLQYCGRHLQGLFLVHKLPMVFLSGGFLGIESNIYVFFCMSVAAAFLIEIPFNKFITYMQEES